MRDLITYLLLCLFIVAAAAISARAMADERADPRVWFLKPGAKIPKGSVPQWRADCSAVVIATPSEQARVRAGAWHLHCARV